MGLFALEEINYNRNKRNLLFYLKSSRIRNLSAVDGKKKGASQSFLIKPHSLSVGYE